MTAGVMVAVVEDRVLIVPGRSSVDPATKSASDGSEAAVKDR